MTQPDSTTPRVDALRKARPEADADLDANRTRNQVANADDVLAARAGADTAADQPQADEAAAVSAAERLDAEGAEHGHGATALAEDDLPGTTYRRGATPLVTSALLAGDAGDKPADLTDAHDVAFDDDQFARAGEHALASRAGAETATVGADDPDATQVHHLRDTDTDERDEANATLDADDVDIVETDETELVEDKPKAAEPGVATAAAATAAAPAALAAAPLFRDQDAPIVATEARLADTTVADAAVDVEDDTERTALIDRDAEREARQKRLGIVAAPAPATEPIVPVAKPTRTTDKWHGSLGLFLLRLITGALLLTQGWAHITHWTETQDFFARSILPEPQWFALGVVIAEIAAGVLLILGLATRFAGLLLLAIEVLLLVFFIYGKAGAIFVPGEPGFKGDREILFAAIGLLFLLLGGGGLAIDKIFRRNRARAREERLLGNTV